MSQITRDYIVINIPCVDKVKFTYRAKELLETLKVNGIDISNVLILPDDVKISYMNLPITEVEEC